MLSETSERISAWVTLLGGLAINGYNIQTVRQSSMALAGGQAFVVALIVSAELLALFIVRGGWKLLTGTPPESRTVQAIQRSRLMGVLSLWIGGTGFALQTMIVVVAVPSGLVAILVGTIAGGACVLAIIFSVWRSRLTESA